MKTDEETAAALTALRELLEQQIESGDRGLGNEIRALHDLIFLEIRGQKEQIDKAFASSEKAILKAEASAERRFESVNEFRGQLADQARTLLPRELFDQFVGEYRDHHEILRRLVQQLSERVTQMEARGGGEKDKGADLKATFAIGVAFVAAIASTVIGLIAMFTR